jgi:protein-tyrosine kinase
MSRIFNGWGADEQSRLTTLNLNGAPENRLNIARPTIAAGSGGDLGTESRGGDGSPHNLSEMACTSGPPSADERHEGGSRPFTASTVRPVRVTAISPLMLQSERHVYAAEQYRIIRTKTLRSLPKPCRLVITSPSVGDGKTFTAINMAAAMALKSDDSTLLIDADLRRPAIHKVLDCAAGPGLANVLAGACAIEDAIFQVADLPRLYVLPAGDSIVNPTELLDSDRWRRLTERLCRSFAHLVLDSPPVDVVADHDLIAAACDGEILVVRPDLSDRTLCLAAIERLRPKLVGVLINAAPEWFLWRRRRHWHYQYYYGQGRQAGKNQT